MFEYFELNINLFVLYLEIVIISYNKKQKQLDDPNEKYFRFTKEKRHGYRYLFYICFDSANNTKTYYLNSLYFVLKNKNDNYRNACELSICYLTEYINSYEHIRDIEKQEIYTVVFKYFSKREIKSYDLEKLHLIKILKTSKETTYIHKVKKDLVIINNLNSTSIDLEKIHNYWNIVNRYSYDWLDRYEYSHKYIYPKLLLHPNCPVDAFHSQGFKHIDKVCNNIVLDLLLLEDPMFWDNCFKNKDRVTDMLTYLKQNNVYITNESLYDFLCRTFHKKGLYHQTYMNILNKYIKEK